MTILKLKQMPVKVRYIEKYLKSKPKARIVARRNKS